MELNHLKYFYVVAREGGFSRASRSLKIAQPAITKTIKTLESHLGVELFERNGRTIALTKVGNDIFRHCEIIFSHVDEITTRTDFKSHAKLKGSINFCAAEPIASHIMPTIIRSFLHEHPNVYPQILSTSASEAIHHISKKTVEFALLFHAPALPENIELKEKYPIDFKLVVSNEKKDNESICSTFIGSREVDDVANKTYPTLSKLQKKYPNAEIKLSTNSLSAHKKMVLDGLGVSILPEFMVRDEIRSGKLKCLLAEERFIFHLKLLSRVGEKSSAQMKAFIEIFAPAITAF
jgi:DNA-binding transcriptional LysR family regulator